MLKILKDKKNGWIFIDGEWMGFFKMVDDNKLCLVFVEVWEMFK